MASLTPDNVRQEKSKDVQLAMRKDLHDAARKYEGHTLWFLAAADVVLADKKKQPVFVVARQEAEAKEWQQALKAAKPTALAIGTCTLASQNGKSVDIVLDKIKGDRKVALKIATLAFVQDPTVDVADKEADADGDGDAAWAEGLGMDADAAVSQLAKALGMTEDEVSRELNANADAIHRELEEFTREVQAELG